MCFPPPLGGHTCATAGAAATMHSPASAARVYGSRVSTSPPRRRRPTSARGGRQHSGVARRRGSPGRRRPQSAKPRDGNERTAVYGASSLPSWTRPRSAMATRSRMPDGNAAVANHSGRRHSATGHGGSFAAYSAHVPVGSGVAAAMSRVHRRPQSAALRRTAPGHPGTDAWNCVPGAVRSRTRQWFR